MSKQETIKISNFELDGFNESFEGWIKEYLVEFLNFIHVNHEIEMKKYLNEYYEVLSGN